MTNTPLNPDDEARLEKALEQSANGQVVSRGSFAQYAQTPLNPDALEVAADAVTMAAGACGVELYGADEDIFAERAVSAYLAVAQPVVNSDKASAWYKGFQAGWEKAKDPGAFVNDVWDAETPNPYNKENNE